MNKLVFPSDLYRTLSSALLPCSEESCAIILGNVGKRKGSVRLLVREVHVAPEAAYIRRAPIGAQLAPQFLVPFVKRVRLTGGFIGFVHTHPFDANRPEFSSIDDAGEVSLRRFLEFRAPSVDHIALVMSAGGCRARGLGAKKQIDIVEVGSKLFCHSRKKLSTTTNLKVFDRQTRAFGKAAQATLSEFQIGIVGLGGTGSVVAQQLAYLGVRKFLFIDPDRVAGTNLNRLVGAEPSDIGSPKVQVVKRFITRVSPHVQIQCLIGSVLDEDVARELLSCDAFFCCTDSHGSRAVLNQLAYQYYLPCFDLGIVIAKSRGILTHIAGRVQMLAPTLSCLTCSNLLNPDAVRRDFFSSVEAAADPYFLGPGEPQPAVISFNSTVASLAVTMFLGAVAGIPAVPRFQLYNGISGVVRPVAHTPDPGCIVCSAKGALGRGDEWPIPARHRQTA